MSRGLPSMTALLGLLAIAGYQNRDKLAEMLGGGAKDNPAALPPGQSQGQLEGNPGNPGWQLPRSSAGAPDQGGMGGLMGGLASSLGASGIGGLLNGGLGELVDRFRQNGHGDAADSWVASGPNKEISPQALKQAIGPDVLDTLAQQTGLSHDELLQRLSTQLPAAVDQYTPEGRLPSA